MLPRVFTGVLCLTSVLISLSMLGTASAFTVTEGGIKYVVHAEEFGLGPGSTKTMRATCPRRTHVVGGGGGAGGLFGDSFLSSSYPFDGGDRDSKPDDGWKAKLSSFDRVVSTVAVAVCTRTTPTYKSKRYAVGPMTSGTDESVPCGAGRAIVHGGFHGPTTIDVGSSFPIDGGGSSPDFWGLRLENVAGQERSVTGYAICSSELAVSYVPSSNAVGQDAEVTQTTSCPPGAPNVVGGGQVNAASFGEFRVSGNSAFLAAQPDPDRWLVEAQNEGGSPISFTVWADCVPNL